MAHGGQSPERAGKGEPPAQTQDIHQPPGQENADGIRCLERHGHVPVLVLGKAVLMFQFGCQIAEDTPVHVVRRGDPKQQAADDPAIIARGWDGLIGGVHKEEIFIQKWRYIKN
jgi:hypothetical protein